MKKLNYFLALGAISCTLFISGCGKDPISVDIWVQLSNNSKDTVFFWTNDNLTLSLVRPNSQLSRVDHHGKYENGEDTSGEIYLKKKKSKLDIDASQAYSIKVDRHNYPTEVIFSWDGVSLSQ